MRTKLGTADWKILRVSEQSPRCALDFAFVGNTMIELAEVEPGGVALWRDVPRN